MLGRCDMMPCLVMKVFLVCKHLFSFCWHLCKSHCKCFAECILLELSKISSKVCWENLFAVGARNIGQNFGERGLAFSVSAHQLGCHCWISIFSYVWKTTRNRFVAGLWLEFQSMSGTIRVENQAQKKTPPSFARLEELEGRLDIDILNFLHWKAGAYGIESSIR